MADWSENAAVVEVDKLTDQLNLEQKPANAYSAEASLMEMLSKGLFITKGSPSLNVLNSPLHSVKRFEDLNLKPELLKGAYAMGYNKPTKIQETALPILLADPPKNMIAQSQSGTGKTAAFVLAMLSRVNTALNYPQAICISPTYALAIQTGEIVARMAQFCVNITLRYVVHGVEIDRNTKITDHMLIGTPGKMLDWGLKLKIFDLNKITILTLDEADVMMAIQEQRDQCIRIHKALNKKCQKLFFSATYNKENMEFARLIVPDPTIIRLTREEESLNNIKQYYVICKNEDEKYLAIENIYGSISIGQAIIFCHSRNTAEWLSRKMTADGHSVAILSGDLTVEQRLLVLNRFRSGLEKILISTNVSYRGIDIEQVTLVINYNLPVNVSGNADSEGYLHRIGRTGRFGKEGIAINLIDNEKSMVVCQEIEKYFKKEIKYLNTDNADEIEKI